MLKIFNELEVFFEDCYREFSVREYSRKIGLSPPTSSKILKNFTKEGLLLSREDRGFLLFKVNRRNKNMKNLSRIYWNYKLEELVDFIKEEFYSDAIILFGSLSKLESKKDSDIDLIVLGKSKKEINLSKFEKKFCREIQIFFYEDIGKINKELRFNVLNGHLLSGHIK